MSSRVAGAGLALLVAVLFAVSIATPIALPGPLAMFAGHPTTIDDRTHQAHTITVKDVYAGLLRAELCNTAGDGTCKSADSQLKLGFRLTTYATLAVTVVAMITAALLAWLTVARSERRKGVARAARITAALSLVGAGLLAVQGPFAEAAVPIGLGMALYGAAALGGLVASFVAVRPPAPIKLRVAERGDQRMQAAPIDPGMFGDGQLRPLGPPQERRRRDARPSQPPVAGEMQTQELFAPAQPPVPSSGPHVQVAPSGPRPPVPASGPRFAPSGPQPPMPNESPLFTSAPRLRPLYDAAPNHGGTGGLKFDAGAGGVAPQPADSLVGPSASLSVSASQFPFAETKVAMPVQLPPQTPAAPPMPPWLANAGHGPAGSNDSWTALEPPTSELPPGWASPEAPTNAAAPTWSPAPVAPPPVPSAPASPISLPPMPWAGPAAPAAPAPGMPPVPPIGLPPGLPTASGALPPVPTTLLGATAPAGPPPVPPARAHRESQQPPPRPGEPPRTALRAAVPMPARPNRPTASPTRPPPSPPPPTIPPPLRTPPRPTLSGTVPPPFAIPAIPAIPTVPPAPSAAPAAAIAKRTDTEREPRADSVSDGIVRPDEVGDTTSTTDVSIDGVTDPGSNPAEMLSEPPPPAAPPAPPAPPAPAANGAQVAKPVPKLPISTAPDSLPPPRDSHRAATGPSPACPQCEAPMAWVEEHLRFYCKSCRMYF